MAVESIRDYLKSISRYSLLTPEQELDLGSQIQKMLPIIELNSPTLEQQKIIRRGQRAKEQMIRSNLRLVIMIAKKYLDRGLPLQDLIQEGNLGLLQAVQKFDHTKGYRFSTYAYWWIRQAITRGIATQSRTVYLPIHVSEKLNKFKKCQREMIQQLGRLPTLVELADSLKWTPEFVAFLAQVSQKNVSLDALVGTQEDTSMLELTPSELPTPEEFVEALLQTEFMQECLDALPEREREILELKYGLTGKEPMTFSTLSAAVGLSRERVRQLGGKGKKRLVAIAKKKAPELELGADSINSCVSAADGLHSNFTVSGRKIS